MKISDITCIYCGKDSSLEALHRITRIGETPAKWVHSSCNESHKHPIDPEVKEITDIIEGKDQ